MNPESLTPGKKITVQQGIHRVIAKVKSVTNKLNLETLEITPTNELHLNDIGNVEIQLSNPILSESYKNNPKTGAFILIDEVTNNTAGVGFLN